VRCGRSLVRTLNWHFVHKNKARFVG